MSHHLIRHIERFIPVSEQLAARLQQIGKEHTLEKGAYLHKPNRVCTTTYFIEKGLVRVFYRKGEKEITDQFSAEGEWITSIHSFLKNVPDACYIQTLEPSALMGIDLQQLEQCFLDFPEMERFGRMLMSTYFLEQSERIVSLQFHTAKERYEYFLKTAKHKATRVPLGMLASHLGMTQETLSRIRAEKDAF
ncbi:Crp/Fnr family transcriptional regulator [Rufibacter ruber]|uniref:Crp/Fnr family transcriptional regulator n=1 Tax=Rufibacter ruber TaxID=1783499 RepID=UPI000AE9E3F7|nr:Crp/Fnr family transcriptional regulator [Rufibacter ruber]